MDNTILLSKISQGLMECCKSKKFLRVNKLTVNVNENSNINSCNLYEYLKNFNKGIVDESTEIKIEIEDLPDQVVIISSIEGDISQECV
ncbi:hypothetical protein CLRAG_19580 [Clostridium ragsdalei P11]|uniref:Uncharacterized protein n=1 Tax=Clostridium ragsdalei P11 TaxID=1353534 RepID=A0A1A6AUA4_9CLOT|nr:hypothetical protein [Clostridium ragsdalei]OBR93659.1 hypothetical protein CLRAG_19580 [Clostridium ragsdalei P11]